MSFCHPETALTLAVAWRLTPDAAARWLACECQDVNNPTNPLNVRFYGRAAQVGRIGGFATYRTARASFIDGLAMVASLAPNYGYGTLLASLGTGDTYRQCRAIEMSSWAAGHYGATDTAPGCLSRGLAPTPPPVVVEEPMDPTIIPTEFVNVSPGATAYTRVNGALKVAATSWKGGTHIGSYGVQPHAEPPRPPASAPLRALRVNLLTVPAEQIETWYVGNDHCTPVP